MKKQTAIEWLVRELELEGYDYTVHLAKQMEKNQIIQAFDTACEDEDRIGEEYYKEMYERATGTK